jgi:hypothetical protein
MNRCFKFQHNLLPLAAKKGIYPGKMTTQGIVRQFRGNPEEFARGMRYAPAVQKQTEEKT